MFPKISDSLLNSVKNLNRISELYRLQIETVQAMSNALSVYNSQMNAISQSISNNLRMYHNIASTVSPLIQVYQNQINITVSNFENIKVWDNFINLAVSAYQNSQEEEFEIEIESIPVTINKTKLQEYIEVFQKLEIPKNVSIYLGISSYILLWLAPYTVFFPSLEPVLWEILKWIFEVLKFFGIIILEHRDPKKFAELTFTIAAPVFVNFIFNKLSKK